MRWRAAFRFQKGFHAFEELPLIKLGDAELMIAAGIVCADPDRIPRMSFRRPKQLLVAACRQEPFEMLGSRKTGYG